jgi:hypothetical protein
MNLVNLNNLDLNSIKFRFEFKLDLNSEIGIYRKFLFFWTKTRLFKIAFIEVVKKTVFGIFRKKSV